jgi:hypothetical protein
VLFDRIGSFNSNSASLKLFLYRALNEAEAKRTELRLVLASRYRELVGSSDEVIRMKERAQELHDLVHALPSLMEKLAKPISDSPSESSDETSKTNNQEDDDLAILAQRLSSLPRHVHRLLDKNDLHLATTKIIELFTLIASKTDIYPLANALSTTTSTKHHTNTAVPLDDAIQVQMRMIFLQVQTLPQKIGRIAKRNLLRSASVGFKDPGLGAETSAAALSSLNLLNVTPPPNRANHLLDTYFELKAKLLVSLLNKLSAPSQEDNGAGAAEGILSKIVLILQYDIILHPYQIFVLREFPCRLATASEIMSSLPVFDPLVVRAKCSNFLAAHLPLIRTKVKSILVSIAGTTASALGQIRQSLYDKTDGADCMKRLDDNGVCTWEDAVTAMVDIPAVLSQADTGTTAADFSQRRFSLWSALFSNTFSSLVHSLLTASFQSVHTRVVSTLRASLANAPPLHGILPHEAYRNMLKIATDLDEALLKVSEDSHELLVHAEEREESERRLRQSLYVQSCEIMGRLVCELRRMVHPSGGTRSNGTKQLIVGRLCYLLKFRLTALPKLLSPQSSPAAMHSTSGMISFVDLQSAFEVADDDEDGLITFDGAMEAVESAFSGTQFRGAELVRETLLLERDGKLPSGEADIATNVTLNELTLLAARGLRHGDSVRASALGTVQQSLDEIVKACFSEWAVAALENSTEIFEDGLNEFLATACTTDDEEWRRLHPANNTQSGIDGVSPFVVGHILDASSILNRTTCPSDSLSPVASSDYALSLGLVANELAVIPTLVDVVRWTLLRQTAASIFSHLERSTSTALPLKNMGKIAAIQFLVDVLFVRLCFFERNQHGFGPDDDNRSSQQMIDSILSRVESSSLSDMSAAKCLAAEMHSLVFDACDLSISSLFGEGARVPIAGELDIGAASSLVAFRSPLPSSRRFSLLPVQADRSLAEIQLRGKVKEKETTAKPESLGAGVMSSGLGFFSSMLKKN